MPERTFVRIFLKQPLALDRTLSFRHFYFEDYEPGQAMKAAGITLTETDVIDFAFQYDPQPFHIDKLAAKESMYGGLIASGWQVAILGFRMLVQAGLVGDASMGGAGQKNMQWVKPVRPGDTLYASAEVLETRQSRSKPDRGFVEIAFRIHNQDDVLVCHWQATHICKVRGS